MLVSNGTFAVKKERGTKAQKSEEVSKQLKETADMLTKKSDFLEEKVEQELKTALKHGTKNKRGRFPFFLSMHFDFV